MVTPAGTQLAAGLLRAALALAGAVGGLVTVALVAVPARAATRADTFSPQTIAAGYAVIGVMLGLVAAIWALSSPAVANNIIATVGWLWLLAVVTVVVGVTAGNGPAGAQLGVWQITTDGERFWFRNYVYWPGAALTLGSALVIGALAARSAAGREGLRIGTVVSGTAGPLLVAAAYFLAAPRLVGIRAEQVSAHLMAPYAVIAGLAGSVLMVAIAQRRGTPVEAATARDDLGGPRRPRARIPAQPTRGPDDLDPGGPTAGPDATAGPEADRAASRGDPSVRADEPAGEEARPGRLGRLARRSR